MDLANPFFFYQCKLYCKLLFPLQSDCLSIPISVFLLNRAMSVTEVFTDCYL